MKRPLRNQIEEVRMLTEYLDGYAHGAGDEKLKKCSEWMERLENNVCGQGFIGCRGGENCESDHK